MITCNHCSEKLHEFCLEDDARKRALVELDELRKSDVVVPDSQEGPKAGKGRAKAIPKGKKKKPEDLTKVLLVNIGSDEGRPYAEVEDRRGLKAGQEGKKVTVPLICLLCEKELQEL